MRVFVTALFFLVSSTILPAQQPAAPAAAAMRSFLASADVTAHIAKAKVEHKEGQANFVQPLLQLAPYTLNLEYRVATPVATAAVHETEAELFYVVDGAATMVTGGKLTGATRTNAQNLSGTGVEGGTSRHIAKGDLVMVPEGSPHWFSVVDGTLVLMSLHLPRPPR